MNWKNFLSNKIIYRSICGVVIAALLVSVAAPVVRRAHGVFHFAGWSTAAAAGEL